ncbi:MAG: putative damage-inducible protein DinB [Rhodothermales bacterium]|jgi:uncharacterized damage-inducible protein DinB
MTHPLAPAIKIFWHNAWMLRNAVLDLDPALASFKMENCNSYDRVIGHIVTSRLNLAKTLGIDTPVPDWGAFGDFRLAAQFNEDNPCPPIGELMDAFAEISEAMIAGFEALKMDDLMKDSPIPVPGGDPNMMDLIAFFAMHESYHIGQLAVMAKCMGRKGLMGA